jgi:hypothetical protein
MNAAVTRSLCDVLYADAPLAPTLEQQTWWRLSAAREHRLQHVGCDATPPRALSPLTLSTRHSRRCAENNINHHICGRAQHLLCALLQVWIAHICQSPSAAAGFKEAEEEKATHGRTNRCSSARPGWIRRVHISLSARLYYLPSSVTNAASRCNLQLRSRSRGRVPTASDNMKITRTRCVPGRRLLATYTYCV